MNARRWPLFAAAGAFALWVALGPGAALAQQEGGTGLAAPRAPKAERTRLQHHNGPAEVGPGEHGDALRSYRTAGYDNLWYPNLQSPPDGSMTADKNDADQLLGTSTESLVDERPLWRLLNQKEFKQTRHWIEQFREWHPDWEPPAELLATLAQGELTQAIQDARTSGDWTGLIALAAEHPDEFTCEKVYNLWALAEARLAVAGTAAGEAVFRRIVTTCERPGDRLVTLQRAAAALPFPMTLALIDLERARPKSDEAATALADFVVDFHGQWLGDAVKRKDFAGGAAPAAFLREAVVARQDGDKASLLGWYAAGQARYDEAGDWFARALLWQPNADNAYALALAWLRAGQTDEARTVAFAWRDADGRFNDLLAEMASQRARLAFEQGAYDKALAYAREDLARYRPRPGSASERGLRVIEAWSLFNLGQAAPALAAFGRLYAAAPGDDLAGGIVYAALAVPDFEAPLDLAKGRGGPLKQALLDEEEPSAAHLAELRYLYYSALMGRYLAAEDSAGTLAAARPIAGQIRERRDIALAVPLGWTYLDLDQPAPAEQWFDSALAWGAGPDAAIGLVDSLRRQGRLQRAEAVARDWADRSPVLAGIARDLILARADEAYEQGDFALARNLAGEAEGLAGPSRRSRLLTAWSLYQSGEAGPATDIFEALYRAEPDAGAGAGLFYAGMASGQEATLERLATEIGGPLRDLWHEALAERYLGQDLYLLAARTDEGGDPRFAGLESPQLSVQPIFRLRDGEDGEGRLDTYGLSNRLDTAFGPHRLRLGLDLLRLDAGTPGPTARIGSVVPPAAVNADTDATVVEPFIAYAYELASRDGADIFDLQLGTTPIGGAVAPRPVGRLGWERRRSDQRLRAELFSESRKESLLSYVGLEDPGDGRTWGRVVETGLRGSLYQALGGPWSVSGTASLAELTGRGVDDNRHLALSAGVGYALPLDGFDYFSVGPRYSFEHYSENLSRFTFGHGGYFSPERLHKFALGYAFQTRDGEPFVLRGSGAAGWQVTREADSVDFPLSGAGAPVAGADNAGLSLDADLSGGYKLGEHVILGANLAGIYSKDFNEIGGGLFLRWSFGARGGVFASDISPLPWR